MYVCRKVLLPQLDNVLCYSSHGYFLSLRRVVPFFVFLILERHCDIFTSYNPWLVYVSSVGYCCVNYI